jgi:hypothetical protein
LQRHKRYPTRHFRRGKNMETTTRKPLFVFLLFGLFLLRYAQRALFRLLLNDPPRNTRRSVRRSPHQWGDHTGSPLRAFWFFDPPAQHLPDLLDHQRDVAILVLIQPFPARRQ